MADTSNQTVVLRVELSEEDTEKRLSEIAIKLADTRKASQELQKAYKAGTVSADEFGQQSVKLNNELRMTQTEQRGLTKTLDAYRAAQNAQAGSYEQAQRQLDVANAQFQKVAGSQDLSTESARALSTTIAGLRKELTQTDASNELFVRSVGRYPTGASLESLVQQLVKLQEQTKGLAAGTEQATQAQMRIIGFQTQAAQAGAKEGKSFEETTNFIREYGEAIRPATADLVKLTEQQQQAAESGEATGETMQQIGFKIGQAQASIKKATDSLKPASTEIAQTSTVSEKAAGVLGKLGDTAGKLPGPLGQTVGGLTATGQGLLTATKAALAFIATPLGLALAAIAAAFYVVKEALTATDEGQEDLAAGSAALGAVLNVLKGVVIEAGKFIVKLFTDPKQAAQDLLDFVEGQLINRVKAYGVIFDGLRNGDFKQATNGVLQLGTGIENVVEKTQALTSETQRAAQAAASISREKDRLEDLEIAAVARNEQQRQQAERLVATAKDRNLTEQQRLANLDEASRLEKGVLDENLKIERQRLSIIQAENAEAARRGTLQDDQRRAEAEQLAKLTQLQGEYEKAEQQRENRRSVLQQQQASETKQAADKAKAAADKAAEHRLKLLRETYALEGQLLDRQLRLVQAGSDQELSLLQQKLRTSYLTELAQKDLTVKQKLLIDRKYEDDSLALSQGFIKQRALAAYDAELANVNAELLAVRKGTQEETELRVEAINTQLEKELRALDTRQDNTARAAQLRANAEKAVQDVRYAAAQASLERYLQGERNALDGALARGKISKAEYDKAIQTSDITAAASRLQLARNSNQDTLALEQQLTTAKIAQIQAVTDAEKTRLQTRQQAAEQFAGQLTSLFAESLSATGKGLEQFARASLELLIDSVSQAIIGEEIKIVAKSFAEADSIATFGATGGFRALAIIGAITAAVAPLKAALSSSQSGGSKFAQGGIAHGPRHSQGGIPLFYQGRPAGIEIEGGEPVLTRKVSENPLLLSLASFVNQAAGGRPLTTSLPNYAHAALGAIVRPVAMQQGGNSLPIDYERLAQATAQALRQSPPVTRWVDYKAAEGRNGFTDSLSSS